MTQEHYDGAKENQNDAVEPCDGTVGHYVDQCGTETGKWGTILR